MLQRSISKEQLKAGSTNTTKSYGYIHNALQTRNTGEIVTVPGSVIDETEGFAAMDSLPFKKNSRNFDIGGGQFDSISEHLKFFYKVDNVIYDPFNRSEEHNRKVLSEVKANPVDSVTSISVLNVILDANERKNHLQLAYNSLKSGGIAFFKVYRGDGSGKASEIQSNQPAAYYLQEITDVFGNGLIPKDDLGNTIIAKKP